MGSWNKVASFNSYALSTNHVWSSLWNILHLIVSDICFSCDPHNNSLGLGTVEVVTSRLGVPHLRDLIPDDLRWSRCNNNQIRSVAQSCPTLCDPMNRSTPGLPVQHQLLEFTQTHVHQVSDAIQPSHPLLSPSPPAPSPSQHQSLIIIKVHNKCNALESSPDHSSTPGLRKNCLPWNWSLVPKRLGTVALDDAQRSWCSEKL